LPYVTPNINVAGAVALVDSQIETPTPEPTATATATATETATPEPTPAATAVTKTPKPDKSVAPTATVPAGTKVYTVQPGDTVSSIARSLGISPSVIIALNHLTPPYKLVAGKDILIPAT
jgi:LysM repeat protein